MAAAISLDELRGEFRAEILRLALEHGMRNVRVFGSVVRGEAGAESDVDFLVELEPGRSLLDRIGFMQDLRALLGREVDVLNERGVHWYARERIFHEAVAL